MSDTSQRPSAASASLNVNQTSNATSYAIIGDTAAATIYAHRLLANGVTSPIILLNEGPDGTNLSNVLSTTFILDVINVINQYLITERIFFTSSGDSNVSANNVVNAFINRSVDYKHGAGPLGDLITAYYLPRLGPWFPMSTQSRLSTFYLTNVTYFPYSAVEQVIARRLAERWCLPFTKNIIVGRASILEGHYVLVEEGDNTLQRQLFLDFYNDIKGSSNVSIATGIQGLTFTPMANTLNLPVYDVQFYIMNGTNRSDFDFPNARLVWRTNPYTYMRLAVEGGLNIRPFRIPAYYRAVIPIPINNSASLLSTGTTTANTGFTTTNFARSRTSCGCSGTSQTTNLSVDPRTRATFMNITPSACSCGTAGGVDLTDQPDLGDLVTTSITLSMGGPGNVNGTPATFTWLGHIYTAKEDLSSIEPGIFASANRTLLILEFICTANTRLAEPSGTGKTFATNILYNSEEQESQYLRTFAGIVADTYNVYTGRTLDRAELLNLQATTCTTDGACFDKRTILQNPRRESPLVTIMETATLYTGITVYQSPGS